jgi:hypothetical protein
MPGPPRAALLSARHVVVREAPRRGVVASRAIVLQSVPMIDGWRSSVAVVVPIEGAAE